MHSLTLEFRQPRPARRRPGGRPLDRRLPVRRLVRHLRILPRDFDEVAARHPDKTFVWIDIEDQADVVGDLDVENFPTLLLQRGEPVAFFGTMLPDAGLADRLVQAQVEYNDCVASAWHQLSPNIPPVSSTPICSRARISPP
jgi:hypothetical protein